MPKLIDRKYMKRYDLRVSRELIDRLLQMPEYKNKNISDILHNVIDKIICSGALSDQKRYVSLTLLKKVESNYAIYPKTVQINFRESPHKIKFLQFYYRIQNDDYTKELPPLPSPSEVIRMCIYDVCENNIRKDKLDENTTLCAYPGQKNADMNRWIYHAFMDIASAVPIERYCEPFMGSTNVYLHLPDKLGISNFYLNDIDTFTYSLVTKVKTDLPNFLATLSQMRCNNKEFDIVKHIIYPPKSLSAIFSKITDKLSPMQKAVYLYYHHTLAFRGNTKTLFTDNPYYTTCVYNLEDFAFPISSLFYKKYKYKKPKAATTKITYRVPHDIVNYNKLLRRTSTLYLISEKLQKANIYNRDYKEFISKFLKKKNTLFYIDSPYFYSEDVYTHKFDHEGLANYVDMIVTTQNYFVLSNRVTVSATRKKLGLKNLDAINLANKYYANKGYFYTLKLFKDQKELDARQVEILISNFPFSGSKPLIKITDEEVNLHIKSENEHK